MWMTNYATYVDVEKLKFGTTGKTFTSSQQTAVTSILTMVHQAIIDYLGFEPSADESLKFVEAMLCVKILRNTEIVNPIDLFDDFIKKILDSKKMEETTETPPIVTGSFRFE